MVPSSPFTPGPARGRRKKRDFSADSGHACALLADGGIKCWSLTTSKVGWIEAGSLPDGTYKGGWREINLGTHASR